MKSRPAKKIGIMGMKNSKAVFDMTASLCKTFTKLGIETLVESALGNSAGVSPTAEADVISDSADMVFSLGGDGTFLRTASLLSGKSTPVLGINLGSLGFLAGCKVEEVSEMVEKIAAGDYEVERRDMLLACVREDNSDVSCGEALNDVVISSSAAPKIIDIEFYVEGSYITTFRADGIICSTPTGSTGYSLSAGGPVVHPTLPLAIITPICPHTLTNRPLVVSNETEIKFRCASGSGDIHASLDGRDFSAVKPGQEVIVRKSASAVNLVKSPFMDYFSILKTKLMWARPHIF